jgi:hypothetical protein
MISKIFTGHSFTGAVKYVVEDERRAVVLETAGVTPNDWRKMTEDFVNQARFNEAKTKACFHAILSFSPQDKVDDKTMTYIAAHYLAEMGLANTQFAIVKHRDKDHPHVHLLANLVDNDGKSIKDSFMGLKGKKIAQRLTKEYGLTPAIKKDLTQTHQEALSEAEAARYQIYQTIQSALPFCDNLEDLAYRLERQDIRTTVKYRSGSTTERQGISFQLNDCIVKGSKVDRAYSLQGLEKALDFNRKWRLTKHDAMTVNHPSSNTAPFRITYVYTSGKPPVKLDAEQVKEEVTKWLAEVAGQLLQPEQGYDPLANELLRSKRRKKRRGLGR